LQILAGIASDIGLPLVLVSLVFLGNADAAPERERWASQHARLRYLARRSN
jgi:hypothetical protein